MYHHISKHQLTDQGLQFLLQTETKKKMHSLFEIFEINGNFLTVVPDSPGFPQDTSLPLISLASTFLVFEISSRYLFQSANDNLGEFLKKKIIVKAQGFGRFFIEHVLTLKFFGKQCPYL